MLHPLPGLFSSREYAVKIVAQALLRPYGTLSAYTAGKDGLCFNGNDYEN